LAFAPILPRAFGTAAIGEGGAAASEPGIISRGISRVRAAYNEPTVAPDAEATAAIRRSELKNMQADINKTISQKLDAVAKEDGIPEWKKAHEAANPKPKTEAEINGEDPRERSLRDKSHDLAKDYLDRATEGFKKLDKASGGRFQRWRDQIDAIDRKLANHTAKYDVSNPFGDPEETTESITEVVNLQKQKWDLVHDMELHAEQMADEGKISLDDAAHFKNDFRRGMALRDLGNGIRSAFTEGLKPDNMSLSPAELLEKGEIFDPNRLDRRLNILNDNWKFGENRLKQAIGDGADDLLRRSFDWKRRLAEGTEARVKAQAAERAQAAARIAENAAIRGDVRKAALGAAGTLGAGTLGALGYEAWKAITHIWNPDTGTQSVR